MIPGKLTSMCYAFILVAAWKESLNAMRDIHMLRGSRLEMMVKQMYAPAT